MLIREAPPGGGTEDMAQPRRPFSAVSAHPERCVEKGGRVGASPDLRWLILPSIVMLIVPAKLSAGAQNAIAPDFGDDAAILVEVDSHINFPVWPS